MYLHCVSYRLTHINIPRMYSNSIIETYDVLIYNVNVNPFL